MDDIVEETFLCGIEDDKKTIEESPIRFLFELGPENKDAFIECYRKVKPMYNMQDMMNAALGLYLCKIYSDCYTTE